MCTDLPQGVQMGPNRGRGWVAGQDIGECGLLPGGWGSGVQGLGVRLLEGDEICRTGKASRKGLDRGESR